MFCHPDHGFDSTWVSDTKLEWQEHGGVGVVAEEGLAHGAIEELPHSDWTDSPIGFGEGGESRGTEHRSAGCRSLGDLAGKEGEEGGVGNRETKKGGCPTTGSTAGVRWKRPGALGHQVLGWDGHGLLA